MRTLVSMLQTCLSRIGYLLKATALACVLGVIEMVQTQRGRRVLGALTLVAVVVGALVTRPIRSVPPGEAAVRVNRLTGSVTILDEGWIAVVPGVHEFRRYPLHDQVYRPADAAHAGGSAAFQSVEGLSLGVDVSVRWALDPERMSQAARLRPDDIGAELVVPTVDGALHGAFAQHTVREIFATQRAAIQKGLEDDLRKALAGDGVVVKAVVIGSIDLPEKYKAGLEALLSEELAAEKMRYTLELKDKRVKEVELDGEAEKVRREKTAEAHGLEQIVAARSQEEAMKHVLPFKERQVEQRKLEAEAEKTFRIRAAEGSAQARRIEADGEADARQKLADAEAYRLDLVGKVNAEQMVREGAALSRHPLLVQKALADKLSDKIQVIIAPPPTDGSFLAGAILGGQIKGRQ